MAVPDGFILALPDDWVTLDLDPDTARESALRLVDVLARTNPRAAEERARVEQLLLTVVAQAIDDDDLLYAVRIDFDAPVQEPEASVAVRFRSVSCSEPAWLQSDVAGQGIDTKVVTLGSGPALRIAERTGDVLSLGMLVPVPGVDDRLAVISLSSTTLSHEDQLNDFFDAITATFSFTWDDLEVSAG